MRALLLWSVVCWFVGACASGESAVDPDSGQLTDVRVTVDQLIRDVAIDRRLADPDSFIALDAVTDHALIPDQGLPQIDALPQIDVPNAASDAAVDATADAAAPAVLVPTLRDPRDRLGVMMWRFEPRGVPPGTNRLTWAAQHAADVGARTQLASIDPSDPYATGVTGTYRLTAMAEHSAYRAFFGGAANTFVVFAYTNPGYNHAWADGMTPAEITAERTEVAELGEHLLRTYPTKTFIFTTWQGDTALDAFTAPERVSGYTAWANARADGVGDAQTAVGGAKRLFSAITYNHTTSSGGALCGTAGGGAPCIIADVAPNTRVDLFGYSAAQSAGFPTARGEIRSKLEAAITASLARVRMTRPAVTRENFVIFDIAEHRELFGACEAVERVAEVVRFAREQSAPMLVLVDQILDADLATSTFVGNGVLAYDGTRQPMFEFFRSYAMTGNVTVGASATNCSEVTLNSVQNVSGGNPVRNGVMRIAGTFPTTTARVYVRSGTYVGYSDDRAATWTPSATSIDVTVPPGVPLGTAHVWVRDTMGRDTNAAFATFE